MAEISPYDTIFSGLIPGEEEPRTGERYTEEALTDLLARQILHLMEHDKENLWSLFYRLDIPDEDLAAVLRENDAEVLPLALARLVMARQRKRMATRSAFPQPFLDEEEWRLG